MRATVVIVGLVLLLLAVNAMACDYATMFVRSYHFDRNPEYNENNLGLGCEAVLSDNWRAAAGVYRNTHYKTSGYAGAAYTPLSAGNWKFGAFVGLITGYGKPVILPLPLVSYERDRWGLNLLIVPPTKKTVDGKTEGGVVGFQVKWKL